MSCIIPLPQLLHPHFWFGQQRQQQRNSELERQKEGEGKQEREREREGKRRTEDPSASRWQADFYYQTLNGCRSGQMLGPTHFCVFNCSFRWMGHQGDQLLLVPACFTILTGSFPTIAFSVNRPYIKLPLDFLELTFGYVLLTGTAVVSESSTIQCDF